MSLLWGFGLLLLGAWFGSMLTDLRWQLNSMNTASIKIHGRTFKVVKVDSSLSWEMLIECPDNPQNKLGD